MIKLAIAAALLAIASDRASPPPVPMDRLAAPLRWYAPEIELPVYELDPADAQPITYRL